MSPAFRRTFLFASAWLILSHFPPASAETLKTAPVSSEVAARWSGSVTKALGSGKLEAADLKELGAAIAGLKELDLSVPEVKASVQPVLAEIETEAYAVISALEESAPEAGHPDGLVARTWILRDQLHPYLDPGMAGWLEQVAPRAVDDAARGRVGSMLAALAPALASPPGADLNDAPPPPPAVGSAPTKSLPESARLRKPRSSPTPPAERNQIFDEQGQFRPEMLGIEGYLAYADRYTEGRMRTAFEHVAKILSPIEFEDLGWGNQFWGTTTEYRAVRGRIFDGQGRPKPGMTGIDGYRAYADLYADGDMQRAYNNVSAVLSKIEFRDLGWGRSFQGTTEEHAQVRGRVLDEEGRPRPGMSDAEGYIAYSDLYHQGQMAAAFNNVAAVLTDAEFERLGWGKQFGGTTGRYRAVRNEVFDEQGRPREGMTKPQGYIAYADRYTRGQMMVAFLRVAAVLTKAEFRKLEWGKQFAGTTAEYQEIRGRVLDAEGQPLPGMKTREGYLAYSDKHSRRQMGTAHRKVSAVLTNEEFARLEWGRRFAGTTRQYRAVRDQVFESAGNPRNGMMRRDGYVAYADKYADGRMDRAFLNVMAVLTDEEFELLEWEKPFMDTTSEYHRCRSLLIGAGGAILPEAHGEKNLDRLAQELSGAKIGPKYRRARLNLRAALSDEELSLSGWRVAL